MPGRIRIKRQPAPGDVIRRDAPGDYTAINAERRLLYVNLRFMRYGTADRVQAAAMFLAVIFAALSCLMILIGHFADKAWAKESLSWLSTPLMLVVGVAVGRAGRAEKDAG